MPVRSSTDKGDPMEDEVRKVVDRIVAAFGAERLDEYFSCFAPDATFVFHTTPERLSSPEEYRALWGRWIADDGFHVRSCRTSDTRVQMLGEVAVVTHDVDTEISTNGGNEVLHERETIVLARRGDAWIAVHEHLSPRPG
jgi:ketosteroid isomerase-like protein